MLKTNCQNTRKKLLKTSILLVSIFSLLFTLSSTNVFAAGNDTISFQGKIVRNDTGYEGLNVTTGNPACVVAGASNDTCDFQALYYTAASGGTLLGTEDFTNEEIGEFGGVFNLALGAGSWTGGSESIFTDVFNNNDGVYIELKFAPDGSTLTETFSRMLVRASAYAIRAGTADIANEADYAFQFDSAADDTGYSPSAGMVYYDSDEAVLKLYTGAAWVDIASGAGGGSLFTDVGDHTYLTDTTDSFVLGSTSYTAIGSSTYSAHLTGLDTSTTPFAWDVGANRLIIDGANVNSGLTVYSNFDSTGEWPLVSFVTEHSGFTEPVLEISQDGTGPATSMYYGSSKIFEVGTQLESAVRKAVVGIGVDTPDERLDINGAIHIHDFTPSTTTNRLYSVASALYWNGSELGSGGGLWTDGGTFSYLSATTDDLVMGSNVVNNAPFFFDVSEGAFVINGTGAGNLFTVNDELADSSPFVIDASGNVGIGTSAPAARLDIAGSSSTIANNTGDITITAEESVVIKADDTDPDNIMEWMNSTGGILAYVDSYGKLVLSAATANNAQLRFVSSAGTDPTVPVSGDLWWNGTELYFNDGVEDIGLLTGNGFTDGVAMSDVANAVDAVAFTFNTLETFNYPTSKLFSIMNNDVETMYLDADGNLYITGSLISDKGLSVRLTNNTGGVIAERSLVTIDPDNNTSFTTVELANQGGAFGVVVGVDVNNDVDKDGNCDDGDICIIAFEGVVSVNTVDATDASRGDYVHSSLTAGYARADTEQDDGMIGVVLDVSNAASGYVDMVFDEQNTAFAVLYMSVGIEKNLYHDVYRIMADDYKKVVLAGEYDRYWNSSDAIAFDVFVDELKINSADSLVALDTNKGKMGLWGGRTFDNTNVDTDGNKYLGASDANDTYYYDRSQTGEVNSNQDSTPETLIDLGIDPYWYKGVSLETSCTHNCSQESNLSEYYNGGLFEVTGRYASASEHGSIGITVVGQGTSSLTVDIASSDGNCSVSSATLTYGERYSFTAGSCSGSSIRIEPQRANYTYGDTFKISSWYIEPVTANDRGSKQVFPKRSYIVATDSGVDILDGDTDKLWMRFTEGSGYILGSTDIEVSAVHMLNGTLYITDNNSTDAVGLVKVSFVEDMAYLIDDDATDEFDSGVIDRNTNTTYTETNTSLEIVDDSVNDVHSAVIPNQPTQEVTVSGWGYIQGDNTTQIEEIINLPYKFNSAIEININSNGWADVTNTPTSLEGCGGSWSFFIAGITNITDSNFQAILSRSDGNATLTTHYYCYTWTATGTVSPRTYSAVATGANGADGGTTIINETDQTAIDVTVGSQNAAILRNSHVTFANNTLYTMMVQETSNYQVLEVYYGIAGLNSSESSYEQYRSLGLTINSNTPTILGTSSFTTVKFLSAIAGTSTVDGKSNTIYIGTDTGLTVLQEKQSGGNLTDGNDESNGSVKYYTKDYISEEMIGDIRGMWPLNYNNANADNEDVSIKGNDLTAVNIDSNDAVSGVRSKAVDFDGSTEYLYREYDADLDFTILGTIGTWVKTSSSSLQNIISQSGCQAGGCGYHPYNLYMEGGYFKAAWVDSVAVGDTLISPATYNDDEWHNVVTSFTNGVIELYVDGNLVDSGSIGSTNYNADSDRWYIGATYIYLEGVARYFSGYIDEPFATAEGLTASQIKRMYEVGKRALKGSHGTNDFKNNLSDDGTGLGGTDITKAVGVDSNGYMYVGMDGSGADDGWVSKIDLNSDTQVDQYTTSTSIALADNDVTTMSVSPSGLELVGTDGIGVRHMPYDTNGDNSSGTYYSKEYNFTTYIDRAYVWMSGYIDSSDSSSDITVYASNDRGSTYVEGVLTNTKTYEDLPEYEYLFEFEQTGTDIIVKMVLENSSTYHTPVYVEQWGLAHMGIEVGEGDGFFSTEDDSVANGEYIEVVHGQDTSDLIITAWVYDVNLSQWVEVRDTDTTVIDNLSNQWNDADPDGVIRSDVRLTNVELSPGVDVGTGGDGDITVSSSTDINVTSLISGRTCADGGDAVNYNISSFNAAGTEATLSSTPSTGCIVTGDEILIINLQGTTTAYGNVGNYETLEVQGVSGTTVTFKTAKVNYYGDGVASDTNLGTATGTQRVMLQRVPNYNDVTVNSSMNFYPSDWAGAKGGVMFFRANGAVSVNGTIHANSKGYRNYSECGGVTPGESYDDNYMYMTSNGVLGSGNSDAVVTNGTAGTRGGGGAGGADTAGQADDGAGGGGGGGYGGGGGGGGGGTDSSTNGGVGGVGGNTNQGAGGGGGANAGTGGTNGGTGGNSGGLGGSGTSTGQGGKGAGINGGGGGGGGGGMYGDASLNQLFFGSGGGNGTISHSHACTEPGGSGGGIVFIASDNLTVSSEIQSIGGGGVVATLRGGSGGGAGGSIKLMSNSMTLGTNIVSASGGTGGGRSTVAGAGGNGGVGRIAIYYSDSISGTTSPTATYSEVGYNNYGLYTSPVVPTIGATYYGDMKWEEDIDTYGDISIQTRSGDVSRTYMDFNGTDDHINLGNPSELQITGNQTIEMWLKPDSFSSRKNPFAKAFGGEGTITQEMDGGFTYYYGTSGGNGGTYQEFASTGTIDLDEWSHVAIVRDLTTMNLYWYIDGALAGETTATHAAAVSGSLDAYIGKGYLDNYSGSIDDVKVWNTARTQTEIQDNMSTTLTGSETGLAGYWKLDSREETTTIDSSTGGNNGEILGATWDGEYTWENWEPFTATTNYLTLQSSDTHTDWTGTNATVAEGDVARDVDFFEDEDESTVTNVTKVTSSTDGGYMEATISSTDISGYDYLTAWVRASQTGNTLKIGVGESAATEQDEEITIDDANTWQKVYWDLSDITSTERDGITKIRLTNNTSSSNVIYIDNVKVEKLLTDNEKSKITSTPDDYLQYRIIFTTTNLSYQPMLENISFVYGSGFSVRQVDSDRVRLYNGTGETQKLKLNVLTNDLLQLEGSSSGEVAGLFTQEDNSVSDGSYVELAHNQDTNDLVITGLVYDEDLGKWVDLKDEYYTVKHDSANQWEDADPDGVIRSGTGEDILGLGYFPATGGTITYTDSDGLNPRSSPAYLGGYTVHTFTSSGTFISNGSKSIEALVVAGGGAGGGTTIPGGGGGGGGGGYVYDDAIAITSETYSVTIGSGGLTVGANGADSIFSVLTANGGGGGGNYQSNGSDGGSGGGGGRDNASATGGIGSQGGDGGNATGSSWGSAGGGGGAGGNGYNGGRDDVTKTGTYSDGGIGLPNGMSGSSTYYTGGGGGAWVAGTTRPSGGNGGGGAGGTESVGPSNGTANRGGGGGGGRNGTFGTGGSGIVIIRYKEDFRYGLYHSPIVPTIGATYYGDMKWEEDIDTYGDISIQTRSGDSTDSTDGTWEDWKPFTVTTNYLTLQSSDTHTDWTGTNATVAEGDVARDVDFFEDEDESTVTNVTKVTSSTDGGYMEATISSTDISDYDYVTAWVRASQTDDTLTLGIGESAATEQDEEITIDDADTWQKVYWDLSDITDEDINGVTKIRLTNNTTNSNTIYIDNVRVEKLMYDNEGSEITSTPADYLQYRIIFTTTDLSYQPVLENISFMYSKGYRIEITDTNTIRLYNNTGETQKLKITALANGISTGTSTEASTGLFSQEAPSVLSGSYVELVHAQDTYQMVVTGWVYDTNLSKWIEVRDEDSTVKHNLSNQWNDADPDGVIRSDVRLTDVELSPGIDVGTGADGDITVSSDTNINTTSLISARSCADGGDAVNYNITAFNAGGTTATLSTTPSTGCLVAGDEILIINLQGTTTAYGNVGNYETLEVLSVSGTTVTFKTAKVNYYGDGLTNDTNLGTATSTQRVMLQRVPNYNDVTVNSSMNFTPSTWNDAKGGVMFFRANGSVSVNGTIHASALGYRAGVAYASTGIFGGYAGQAFCGLGGGNAHQYNQAGSNGICSGGGGGGENESSSYAGGIGSVTGGAGGGGGGAYSGSGGGGGGAGGGYGTFGALGGSRNGGSTNGGTNVSGNGGAGYWNSWAWGGGGGGGGTYGTSDLSKLYFGSGGGGGGTFPGDGQADNTGHGGGVIHISANSITVSGIISSNGASGNAGNTAGGGGGGAGGSVKISGNIVNIGTSKVTATGGTGGTCTVWAGSAGGAGGSGRIATYYSDSISGTSTPVASSTEVGYNNYGLYTSPIVPTIGATYYGDMKWEEDIDTYGDISIQTRSGDSTDSTDGTWEDWKPFTVTTNYLTLQSSDTHTDWTGTNATVAEGDVARNVDFFEDEDESTVTNTTKVTSSTDGGYMEATISSTDISGYDYLTAWVRASQTGNTLKIGIGESAATEQDEEITIDDANTWQKIYWDLSDITNEDINGVTKIRLTNNTSSSNVIYIDNVRAEKLMYDNEQSEILTTPADYLQYRIIFTTTNLSYQPVLENISFVYGSGFRIEQVDSNTVRLYNGTDSTQKLRVDAMIGVAPTTYLNAVTLSPGLAQVDYLDDRSSIWINRTGNDGNFMQFQSFGTDTFVVDSGGNIVTEGMLTLGVSGDQGSIRYNATDDVIEFTNDGSTWLPLGAATAKVVLSPEYGGAVLVADTTNNTGSMTSDSDTDSNNYYEWSSSEVSLNDYDVRVRFTLPSNFESWSTTALTLNFVTEATGGTNSKADIYLYLATSGSVDGSSTDGASTVGGTWTTMSIAGADLGECDAANETCMLIIRMYSANDSYVRVGDIELNFDRSL